MPLSINQFNKIALKEDIEKIRIDMMTKGDKNEILKAVNEIKKKFDDHEDEHVANIAAHNRIQGDLNDVRNQTGLEIKHPVLD